MQPQPDDSDANWSQRSNINAYHKNQCGFSIPSSTTEPTLRWNNYAGLFRRWRIARSDVAASSQEKIMVCTTQFGAHDLDCFYGCRVRRLKFDDSHGNLPSQYYWDSRFNSAFNNLQSVCAMSER
jgi:hypothetical protein